MCVMAQRSALQRLQVQDVRNIFATEFSVEYVPVDTYSYYVCYCLNEQPVSPLVLRDAALWCCATTAHEPWRDMDRIGFRRFAK